MDMVKIKSVSGVGGADEKFRMFNIKDSKVVESKASYQQNLKYTICFERPNDDYCTVSISIIVL